MEWHEWLVAGAAIVILAGYLIWRFKGDLTFSSKALETDGYITNWFSMREKGKEFFYPLIEYTPEGGSKISFRAEERSEGKPMFPPGTKVRVKYLPKDPRKVKIIYPEKK
jgi:hypothetical protein